MLFRRLARVEYAVRIEDGVGVEMTTEDGNKAQAFTKELFFVGFAVQNSLGAVENADQFFVAVREAALFQKARFSFAPQTKKRGVCFIRPSFLKKGPYFFSFFFSSFFITFFIP